MNRRKSKTGSTYISTSDKRVYLKTPITKENKNLQYIIISWKATVAHTTPLVRRWPQQTLPSVINLQPPVTLLSNKVTGQSPSSILIKT